MTGVYKIESILKSERCYVGSAINVNRRWCEHKNALGRNKHYNKKLQNHYNKYGENDLLFTLLAECGKEELTKKEQFYIDSLNPYFNICKGAYSCLGRILSIDTRKKISQSHLGIKNPPEAIEKIRQANLGRKNPHTKEWDDKISKSQKGRKLTTEHKRKLSLAKKGKPPWNKGKKTGQVVWNKGKKGAQVNPRKGKKLINGKYVFVDVS